MKIAIIGGGMAGLGAAYELVNKGVSVIVFEKGKTLGGLAESLRIEGEPLELFYHHMFPNYDDFFEVAKEIGVSEKIFFRKAKTANFFDGTLYPFSTPLDLLRFSPVSFLDRIKTGLLIAYLKLKRNWKTFEEITATEWLQKHFGERVYKVLWEPLLYSKFGTYAPHISMAWLWGRVFERPSKFGYFYGGFDTFVSALEKYLCDKGVIFHTSTPVSRITRSASGFEIETSAGRENFKEVIIAAPPVPFSKIAGDLLPSDYRHSLELLPYVGSVCTIAVLKKKLSPFYWINIQDTSSPFVVVVEHANFVDEDTYGGYYPVYIARYIDPTDPFYALPDDEYKKYAIALLKKINPDFQPEWVKDFYVFKAPYTQPVVKTYHLSRVPHFKTPVSGLWWVSMSHIYPWDRSTNRGFKAGRALVRELLSLPFEEADSDRDTKVAAVVTAGSMTMLSFALTMGAVYLPFWGFWGLIFIPTLLSIPLYKGVLILARRVPALAQIAKFALVGGFSTFIELAILNTLFAITGITSGLYYSLFKTITFLVAVGNAYIFNRKWTFASENENRKKEFSTFFFSNLVGLIINVSTASFIVNFIGAPTSVDPKVWGNIGAVIAVFAAMIWNFITYKYVVFKKK